MLFETFNKSATVIAAPFTAIPLAHAVIALFDAVKLVAVIPAPIVVVAEVSAEGGVVLVTVEAPPPTIIPQVVFSEPVVLVAVEIFLPVALPFKKQFFTVFELALVIRVERATLTTDVYVVTSAAVFVIVRLLVVPDAFNAPSIVTLSAPLSSITPLPEVVAPEIVRPLLTG